MSVILEKIKNWQEQNLPFVAYKKTNETTIAAFFQQTDVLFYTKNYTESGFVFAPFDDKNESVLIPKNESDFLQEKLDFEEVVNNEVSLVINKKAEEFHCEIVDNAIQEIVDNQLRKVVISRREEVVLSNFDVVTTFKRLVTKYPTAMVYVWFHPKVGLWLGATPETLVKINESCFETMSLAGTQVYNGTTQVTWQEKELDEQQVVTDYIVSNLSSVCEEISAGTVETIKAGNLLHLKTKVTGKLKAATSELITRLHPTPAVCGFPKEKAKDFILQTENYNREFYTGFLGELNLGEASQLFVNLRCMQIKSSNALIYVGGGITKNSNPQKEFQETVAKSSTMKSVL